MTRLFRINGAALLSLVAALLVATWPFFAAFTVATLAAGLVFGLVTRSWNWHHPSTVALPDRLLHSEINVSAIPIRGDAGGLLFAVASVAVLLGLPQLRWFLTGSLLCAAVVAFALITWRRQQHQVVVRSILRTT
jgi:hypothetical protein